jgi:hypothetical protein
MSARKLIEFMKPHPNALGGLLVPEERKKDAARADLITLPRDVPGKNCSNCDFIDKTQGTCSNRDLLGIPVNERMSCKLWYHKGILEAGK